MLPLVVDLDGTLLNSDMLIESGLSFIRKHPLQSYKPVLWLKHGKTHLKEKLAYASDIDVCKLPYNTHVIELIQQAKQQGRHIVLATATHEYLANKIADHLELFDEVLSTNQSCNLSGSRKRDVLIERFGRKGFEYLGNSLDDLPVWEAAESAVVVNPEKGVQTKAQAHGNVSHVINNNPSTRRKWRKALRLHQWLKNLLIFVPLLAAHQLTAFTTFAQATLAFILFGICASSVYLLNDLLDLNDDRHHPTKKDRPFAAGALSVKHGLMLFPVLLGFAFLTSLVFLPIKFTAVLLSYYCLTLLYSFVLKRFIAIDVIVLAMLYTIRIIAGAAATNLQLTFWILAFSMFIFLSLALVKRYAELLEARNRGQLSQARGRGYYPDDLEMISSLGASSGYLSVMVLALYIREPHIAMHYQHPKILWLCCPLLLLWITRVWMLTHRGLMHDDPVVFAIKDKLSLLIGALFMAAFWMAA